MTQGATDLLLSAIVLQGRYRAVWVRFQFLSASVGFYRYAGTLSVVVLRVGMARVVVRKVCLMRGGCHFLFRIPGKYEYFDKYNLLRNRRAINVS